MLSDAASGLLRQLLEGLVVSSVIYFIFRKSRRFSAKARALMSVLVFAIYVGLAYEPPFPADYLLNVVVESETPLTKGEINVVPSVAGVVTELDGRWEIRIPSATLPTDRSVRISVESRRFERATSEPLVLTHDQRPQVLLRLTRRPVFLRGVVQDDQHGGLAGVRVHVVGYGEESVTTDSTGGFVLRADADEGELVRVRAEHSDFESVDQLHMLSKVPMTITLSKASQ